MPVTSELGLLFNALPRPYLLLSRELVIEAVSDAYLAATLTQRAYLLGRYVYEVFPDNPQTPKANVMHNLHASLAHVLATGQPHEMAQQHYYVPDPAHSGQFIERYWQSLTAPVFDAHSQVVQFIHSVLDVTAQVQAQAYLQESQAAEQAAYVEAERQRQRFHEVLMQLPAHVAVYHGPDHIYQFVNPPYQSQFPHRSFAGRPFYEAMPEASGLGVVALFDQVYQTGEPYYVQEMEGWFDFQGNGEPEQLFFNLSLHPLRNAQGHIDGVLDFSYSVTEQVRARRQVEQLNQELETRVQERTQQLRHQQGLLTQIMRQVPAAIATLDGPAHHFTFFNDACQALSKGRIRLGLSVAKVSPEVVPQGFIGLLDQVYATGQPFTGTENPIHLFDEATGQPELRYQDFIYQPLTDEQHQTQGILAFIVDVTDKVRSRQHAEALQAELLVAAQQQAAERLAFYQIFEQTPALVALLRAPSHRYEYVNPTYQALFPGRQLVGLNVFEAVPELQDQGFVGLLDQVYQTGETYFGQEVPFRRASAPGQPIGTDYFNFTYQAYREKGEVAGVSIFAFDVTEQALGRQEHEVQRQELEQLFMQAPAPIVILDGPNLVFQLINPAYQHIFPGRALAGKPLLEALPELVGTPIPDLFQRVYQTGEPVTVQELPLLQARHEGHAPEEIYWTFTYQARRTAHGIIDGVRVFAHDVTEQVRTRQRVQELNEELADTNQELAALNEELQASNEELNKSNTQLIRTNVDLDNFIYTASHDLKAPISNIEGLLLALERELPAASRVGDVPYMLTLMQEATERFKRTITHLTDISRLQKEHDQAAELVRLDVVVEAVRLDLLPLIEQTQAQLEVQVPASVMLTFSEKNLRSVVYNLLSNALKYRYPDRVPQVRVSYLPQHEYQVLEVQDNGLGMDLSHSQEKLFAMFQRLHTHVEGTGIGLYMVKKIVENAGGRIEVASQLGQGSTFRVYFRR
jgi:signal transduction histidine kinase